MDPQNWVPKRKSALVRKKKRVMKAATVELHKRDKH